MQRNKQRAGPLTAGPWTPPVWAPSRVSRVSVFVAPGFESEDFEMLHLVTNVTIVTSVTKCYNCYILLHFLGFRDRDHPGEFREFLGIQAADRETGIRD